MCVRPFYKHYIMTKKIVRVTEAKLLEMIENSVREIFLAEGIDVDANRNITMTDKHENLIDTSIENNPTLLTDFLPNVNVWSIFKRKDDEWYDANPLIYALKNEGGYKLTNATKFKNRLEYIVNKFLTQNSGMDVTIAVPSTNELNKYFASVVARGCKNPQYIDNLLVKMSLQEVDDMITKEDSTFRKYYGRQYAQKYQILQNYYRTMRNGFQFHKVHDMDMRAVIEYTIKMDDDFYGKYVDAINGKNVIIVDDSIALGNSIKESCKIISENYTPKSITVLTLFSPLYYAETGKIKK